MQLPVTAHKWLTKNESKIIQFSTSVFVQHRFEQETHGNTTAINLERFDEQCIAVPGNLCVLQVQLPAVPQIFPICNSLSASQCIATWGPAEPAPMKTDQLNPSPCAPNMSLHRLRNLRFFDTKIIVTLQPPNFGSVHTWGHPWIIRKSCRQTNIFATVYGHPHIII